VPLPASDVASLDCLYLDYDGVVHAGGALRHREPPFLRSAHRGHELFEYLPTLELLLEPYPTVRIVLSTSWVTALSFEQAKSFLTLELQRRVIGATYDRRVMSLRKFQEMPRYKQILQDVERRKPARWIAIDDYFGEDVPASAQVHFVKTPPRLGLGSSSAVKRLKRCLMDAYSPEICRNHKK
jgi:hypothetical protein